LPERLAEAGDGTEESVIPRRVDLSHCARSALRAVEEEVAAASRDHVRPIVREAADAPQVPVVAVCVEGADGLNIPGNVSGLVLDVKTIDVSGVVTYNGAQPTSSCTSGDRAEVMFHETTQGYSFSIPVPCDGANAPFNFSGKAFPGTYRLSVRNKSSNLPVIDYVAAPSLNISGNVAGLALDVKTVDVSGLVTYNGAQPTSTCTGVENRAQIMFYELNVGYSFSIPVPCNGGSTPFTFLGKAFPGTYRISVRNAESNLPVIDYVPVNGLRIE
jgi:hypothetical protein